MRDMKKKDDIVFINTLIETFKGRRLWKQILKNNVIDLTFDFIVLIPEGNAECNYYTLLYLNKFIEYLELRKNHLLRNGFPIIRRNEKFYILTDDEIVYKSAEHICRRISKSIWCSRGDIDKILSYYAIYPFSDRLIIALLDQVSGRRGYEVLRKNGFSTEELVANGIYDFKIRRFSSASRPRIPKVYTKDSDILNFIRTNDLRLRNDRNKR